MPTLSKKRTIENDALSNLRRTNSKPKKVPKYSTTKSKEPQKIEAKKACRLLNTFVRVQNGYEENLFFAKSIISSITEGINNLVPYETISPFQRRATAMQWHPSYSNHLVIGSKGGELYLWNISDKNSKRNIYVPGIGPGGSITQLKIHEEKPSVVFTSCLTGEVSMNDLVAGSSQSVVHSGTMGNWFVSLDVNISKNMLVAGDCKGQIFMTSCDGQRTCQSYKKLHKSKILHVEFHKRNPDLLVTASLDHSVKVWDVRNMNESLVEIVQDKPINSACFSPRDGTYLLTTDQNNYLKVYSSPFWNLTQTIKHPHRHFQHITPIKASWHPSLDIAVVGRFPESNDSKSDKSIDFYNTSNGEMLTRLKHNDVPGICSLNMFNNTGECLASAMGSHIIVWKSSELKGKKVALQMENMTESDIISNTRMVKHSNIPKSKQIKKKPIS